MECYVPLFSIGGNQFFLLSSLPHPHPLCIRRRKPVRILLVAILEPHGKSPWIKAKTQVKNQKVKKKEQRFDPTVPEEV